MENLKLVFKSWFLTTCFLTFLLFQKNANARLSIASIDGLAEQKIATQVALPIFKQAGIDVIISPMPAARANRELLMGRQDGNLLRIASFGNGKPNLIKVPTAYAKVNTYAYAKAERNIIINSVEDFKKYHIAVVRGVQTSMNFTTNMPHVHLLTSLEQAIDFVLKDRADIVITSNVSALLAFQKKQLVDMEPIFFVGQEPLYIFLHKKHKPNVKKLDRAIKNLQQLGVMDYLVTTHSELYLNSQAL